MTTTDTTLPAPVLGWLETFAGELDDCHEQAAPGGTVPSPAGWTIASVRRLPAGTPVPGTSDTLAAVRDEPAGDRAAQVFGDALVRLHWRLLRDVLDGAVSRLDGRTSEGAPLLGRQLVRGTIADVALALSETRDLLGLPRPTAERRRRIHRDLVAAGRTALGLYGASSFAAEGPGRLLYAAELLGNTYLHAGEPEEGAGRE
ncbi:hypothetical protein ACIG54_06120 [Streptomyces achromogenes]|uniref:hypothetical protein n=1 Tax=Streptomyces achromogenes TaxID=67255 RepID=UPI0004CA2FD9|nr:hypothetical protein [Streptomyces achromogenes]